MLEELIPQDVETLVQVAQRGCGCPLSGREPKTKWDGTLINQVKWKVSLPTPAGMVLDDL